MIRLTLPLLLAVAGCGQAPFFGRDAPDPGEPPVILAPTSPPGLRLPEIPDIPDVPGEVNDAIDVAEAASAARAGQGAGGRELGIVTVSLGDPGDRGLWVKSDLVRSDTPGTVRSAGGRPVPVTLRPLGSDGGPQISLEALQALDLPVTGLHPVILSRAG